MESPHPVERTNKKTASSNGICGLDYRPYRLQQQASPSPPPLHRALRRMNARIRTLARSTPPAHLPISPRLPLLCPQAPVASSSNTKALLPAHALALAQDPPVLLLSLTYQPQQTGRRLSLPHFASNGLTRARTSPRASHPHRWPRTGPNAAALRRRFPPPLSAASGWS